MTLHGTARWCALLFTLLPIACVGQIGSSDGASPGAPGWTGGPSGGPDGPDAGVTVDAARSHLHHLTSKQYVNTVRDLLEMPTAAPVIVDDVGDVPSSLLVEKLNSAAEYLVSLLAHRKFVPCDVVSAGTPECAAKYIASFGARAFRRPLSEDETTWLTGLFTAARTTNSFAESIDQVTLVILQAPQFFYIAEQGLDEASLAEGLRRLDGYERASRLSYLLWDSMPDATLIEAARTGKLDTAEGVAAQAKRMLGDARARTTLTQFLVDDWLELNGTRTHVGIKGMVKDKAVYPLDGTELRDGMRAEVEKLVERVLIGDGSFKTLLTSTDAYVNAPLAKLYGAKAPAAGTSAWVTLDPTQRSGLLTRAAFLSVYSNPQVKSPIRRGAYLVKRLLCQPIGNPPPDVSPTPIVPTDETGAHRTVRQTVTAKTSTPTCNSCHGIINPAGFAFEHYDGLGQWEEKELGKSSDGTTWSLPIDDTGELHGTDVEGTFKGIEISQRLATSRTMKDCLVTHWFTKAFGRPVMDPEKPSLESVQTHFAANDDLKELVLALVQSPAFLYVRQP